jgi:hypothetical protein
MGLRHALAFVIFGLAALALAPMARAQNLVQDPGFENATDSNTAPGWTLSSGFGTDYVNGQSQSGGAPATGSWYAEFTATSASNAQSGTLSQMIATTPGQYYTVTFFLANFGAPHNTFLATFGGQTLLSLTDASAFGYQQYTMVVRATSTQTKLAFTGEQDPSSFGLDDVDVEAGPAPVMGGGLVSLGVAVAGFVTRRLRRRQPAQGLAR